ncbi:alpha/beta hydrolase [Bradyrhizobium sp. BR 10289]|uniref:alpha/beta fold hydrolase n=1 Tax=Bradyrhizobium sp. BR 10289 TaxID=2749993 RepID=UPI001C64FFF1|nr:alpha/beta hydrolase [Bradyrhizobium sp. BR 10289]MBW7970243.1 alpha/beta hydrolase [Bradyrhizobium sp. BR 10289]
MSNPRHATRKAYAQTTYGAIHYAEIGEGPPLLMLSETARTWRHFERIMPLLAPHFRTIAIDTPGYGNSHALPEPLSIESLAECVAAFLPAIGLRSSNLFGIHLGNKIASAVAANFPERIDRLVLAGQTHSIIPEVASRNEAIKPIVDGYLQPAGENADGSHLVRQWLRTFNTASGKWWPTQVLTGAKVTEKDIEDAESTVSDYLLGWRSVDPVYRAVYAYDLAEAYRTIRAPTLILELTTPQETHMGPQAQRIAAMLSSGVSKSVPVTYASAMQTEAAPIAEAIIPFLLGGD